MLDGAAGGGSLPGGVWAPAGMASHVVTAAARRMRELSMRQLCVPLYHVAHAHDSSERPKRRRHTALRGRFADPKQTSVAQPAAEPAAFAGNAALP